MDQAYQVPKYFSVEWISRDMPLNTVMNIPTTKLPLVPQPKVSQVHYTHVQHLHLTSELPWSQLWVTFNPYTVWTLCKEEGDLHSVDTVYWIVLISGWLNSLIRPLNVRTDCMTSLTCALCHPNSLPYSPLFKRNDSFLLICMLENVGVHVSPEVKRGCRFP